MLRLPCVLAVVLSASVALADEATRRLEARAGAAIREGHFVEALALSRAIWERDPTAIFAACNIGTLSYGAGDMPQAAEWLTLCVRLVKPRPSEQKKLAKVVTDLALAKQRVGTIEVFTNREGAKVSVAGRPAETGTPVFVNPGQVVVAAQHKDRVARVEVDVPAGEERLAIVEFREPTPPPAPGVVAPVAPIAPVRPVSGPMPSVPGVPGVGSTNWYPAVITGGAVLTVIGIATGVSARIGAQNAASHGNNFDEAIRHWQQGDCSSMQFLCDERDNAWALRDTLVRAEAASFTLAGASAAGTVVYAIIARPQQSAPLPLVALQIDRPGSPAVVMGVKGFW